MPKGVYKRKPRGKGNVHSFPLAAIPRPTRKPPHRAKIDAQLVEVGRQTAQQIDRAATRLEEQPRYVLAIELVRLVQSIVGK